MTGGDEDDRRRRAENVMVMDHEQEWPMHFDRIRRWYGLSSCIECGRCTASCPAALPSHLRARNVIREVIDLDRTLTEERDDIWHCTTCFDCQDRCPKGVRITEAIMALRSLASSLTNSPDEHRLALQEIARTSNTFPLDDEVRKVRGRLSLPLDPPDCAHDEEELAAFQRLLEILDFRLLAPKELKYWPPRSRPEEDGGED
ncbi:MAG: 4Fe-4S dicluster domain-containing protein [Thermoplasmata archaeon]|nr:MAG: 4Fe-4S dicluster domain-containing protein [Thermoplasmata archaeon]